MIPFTHKRPALEIIKDKILTKDSIIKPLIVSRFFGKRIVFTNGCFDLLHQGHIDYLAKASDLGGMLVVGINSDSSIQRLGKGSARPIQDENSRALILASLHFVDAVIIFQEDTPEDLIHIIKPEVLVKGADYDASETDKKSKRYIVGSDLLKEYGGEVKTIEFLEGYSTSAIEAKIKNA
jgi:rfaE bifunctional protein nucleotidyltransferase chain/domain